MYAKLMKIMPKTVREVQTILGLSGGMSSSLDDDDTV
jgi:hypothetical protein